MAVKIMPVSDLRRRTHDVIEAAQDEDNVVYITQHGRPAAVLMNYERYEMLMAYLEDLSDLASLQEAASEPVRPYEEFLSEFDTASGTTGGQDR
jgi:prevent-host-death family protein